MCCFTFESLFQKFANSVTNWRQCFVSVILEWVSLTPGLSISGSAEFSSTHDQTHLNQLNKDLGTINIFLLTYWLFLKRLQNYQPFSFVILTLSKKDEFDLTLSFKLKFKDFFQTWKFLASHPLTSVQLIVKWKKDEQASCSMERVGPRINPCGTPNKY